MNELRNQIHDMIQTFPLDASPEMIASKLLDILQAMNERMDQIEGLALDSNARLQCLANGIKPD